MEENWGPEGPPKGLMLERQLARIEAKLDALVDAILEAEHRDTAARIRAEAKARGHG